MTNKEKLEIIDKKLDELYEFLKKDVTKDLLLRDYKQLTQSIYNLESIKLLLEEIDCKPQNVIGFNMESQERIDEDLPPFIPEEEDEEEGERYICPKCGKTKVICYGEFIKGECYSCGTGLVKEE